MSLQELESKVWKNKVKQKTIDLVQNASSMIEEGCSCTEIGAYLYRVDTSLEIYNPILCTDIEILKELSVELSKLSSEFEEKESK